MAAARWPALWLGGRWVHAVWTAAMGLAGLLFIAHPQHTPDETHRRVPGGSLEPSTLASAGHMPHARGSRVHRHVLLGTCLLSGALTLGGSKAARKIDQPLTPLEAPAPFVAALAFGASASLLLNFRPAARLASSLDSNGAASSPLLGSPLLGSNGTMASLAAVAAVLMLALLCCAAAADAARGRMAAPRSRSHRRHRLEDEEEERGASL